MQYKGLLCSFALLALTACSTMGVSPVVTASSHPEAAASATPSAVPSVVPFPAKSAEVTRLGVGRGFSISSLSAMVGGRVELGVGMSPDVLPSLKPDEPSVAEASIRWTDWNLCVASLTPLRPGPIPFTVSLNEKRVRGLVAGLDPATTSTQVPLPEGVPSAAPDAPEGMWVITDAAGWRSFLSKVTASEAIAPVDFSFRSLVAVISDSDAGCDAPVVTHVSTDSDPRVTVVKPQLPGPTTQQRHVVTLLSISKVPADASAVFVTLADHDAE